LAKKIVEFRQKNGGFKTVSDLMAVQGIGEKKFDQLKSMITVK
jgi:competence protein ComEA